MQRKALVSIFAAAITAIISAVMLYQTLFVGDILQEAGLIGIFLASLFSHLTIVGRDMFVPAFVRLITEYSPLHLGFSAGLGGAIGEVTTYYWGLGIKEALEKNRENSALSKWIEKYGLLAILLVASSPLPDTPIALLAGAVRYPFKKFLIVQTIGKIAFYSLGAAVGGAIFAHLGTFMDELMLSAMVVGASVTLCIIASWRKSREEITRFLKKVFR